jgi:hypothetical protein
MFADALVFCAGAILFFRVGAIDTFPWPQGKVVGLFVATAGLFIFARRLLMKRKKAGPPVG